jgi:hypothetical protein
VWSEKREVAEWKRTRRARSFAEYERREFTTEATEGHGGEEKK